MSAPSLATPGGFLKAAGFEGQIATLDHPITISRKNEGAAAIQFGRAVARGASGGCKAPASDSDIIIGIAVRDMTLSPASVDGNNTVSYAQNAMVTVLKDGFIYAVPADDVRDGDQVLSITDEGGQLTGTKGHTAGTNYVAVTNAYWDGACTAGQVGKIRIAGVAEAVTTTS